MLYLQVKLTWESLRKTKSNNWRSGRKQVEELKVFKSDVWQLTINDVIPDNQINEEAKKWSWEN